MNLRILSSLTLKIAGAIGLKWIIGKLLGNKNVTVQWKYIWIIIILFFLIRILFSQPHVNMFHKVHTSGIKPISKHVWRRGAKNPSVPFLTPFLWRDYEMRETATWLTQLF